MWHEWLPLFRPLERTILADTDKIKEKKADVENKINEAKKRMSLAPAHTDEAKILGEQLKQLEIEKHTLEGLAAEKEKQLMEAAKEISELRAQLEALSNLVDLGMNHADHQLFEMKPFLGLELGETSAGGGTKVVELRSTMLGSDEPYSPAADVGITNSDVIITIDSMPITSEEEFRRVELVLAVGDEVPVQVRGADGAVRTVSVEVGGEGVPRALLHAVRELALLRIREKVHIQPGECVYHKILGDVRLISVRPFKIAFLPNVHSSSAPSACAANDCAQHTAPSLPFLNPRSRAAASCCRSIRFELRKNWIRVTGPLSTLVWLGQALSP